MDCLPHATVKITLARLLAALVLLVGNASVATGQTPAFPAGAQIGIPTLSSRSVRTPVEDIALEGAIDPEEYIVGPGDVFSVSIGGSNPKQISASVSADGLLVIPEAGSFRAAGRTLAVVLGQARPALARRYQNVLSDVTLSEPRRFYVHVTGAVLDPGRHVVRSVARVEDALMSASLETPVSSLLEYGTPPEQDELRPAYRNVQIERADGATQSIDIARYYASGDTRYNPYLRDGDRVRLPAFAPLREGVFVGGAVLHSGIYDLRPGDTVLDLAAVAGATEAPSFRLVRRGEAEQTLTRDQAARIPVQARDQISVGGADPLAGAARAEGAVTYPGLYPIRSGETTLGDLLRLAGGLAPDALARGAYLERTSAALDSAEVNDIRADGLDLLAQVYYRQEAARTPRIGLDLTSPEAAHTVLRDGDRLVVPYGGDGVRVFGAVARPGFVPFTEGRDADAYVEAAGGRAEGAQEVYVVEAGTGRLAPEAGQALELGDAVFVSREAVADTPQSAQLALQQQQADRDEIRQQREERRDERQVRFQLAQTAISAVAATASIIFAVIALK